MTTAVAAESETMQPRAMPEKRFLAFLTPILVLALAVRVAFVLIRQSSVQLVTGDAYWYHFQAKLVAQGRGFLNPFDFYKEGIVSQGADHPPGFVVVLTILDWLGIDSAQGQRLVMCLVGTVSVAVIAFLGRRLGGGRVGLIAAAIAALYPNMWINDGMLMVETVFILATAVALLGCYRYVSRPNRVDVAVISIALTVAAMTRPEAILLFLLLPVPIVLGRREVAWKERVLQLVLAACIPILAFAPWVLYNQSRFEDPVFISTGAGQTLAAGNCDLTFSGEHLGFYDTKCLLAPQIQEPTTTDRSLRDSEYRQIARSYIGAHSSDLPKVMAARVGRVWHLFRVDQSVGLDGFIEGRAGGPPGSGFFLVREALWAYFVLAPLAIYGLVALRRRRTLVYPLLMQPALVTLVAAMTFGITRYRAGAEVTIVVCAAVTIEIIASKLFPPRTPEVQPLPTAQPEVTA